METIIYNQKGEKTGKFTLPESVFGVKWNSDMVHQVAQSMLSSRRKGTAHTKTRGEVSGGGKKPWRQKGTGRARHGSTRSPIWVGGGVAHGPRNDKNYSRKVNKKTGYKALCAVLSQKARDGEVLFVDSLVIPAIKTAEAKIILKNLSGIAGFEKITCKPRNAAFIVIPRKEMTLEKSFRNLSNVAVGEARNLNTLDALQYEHLIFVNPEESITTIVRKNSSKSSS